jgi:hypothetical protein
MTTMIVELYEALRAAGAPEDKAQAAARALADHERRFDHVDTELATIRGEIKALEGQVVMVKWITGAPFAGFLPSSCAPSRSAEAASAEEQQSFQTLAFGGVDAADSPTSRSHASKALRCQTNHWLHIKNSCPPTLSGCFQ